LKTEDVLHLIVIDDSSNDIEVVTNRLRDAGHAVRTERVEDDEDLREALSRQRWDMVLAKPQIPDFSALDALQIVNDRELDLPLVVLVNQVDEEEIAPILAAGARDIVSTQNIACMLHRLVREFSDLHKRRRHRECETMLQEASRRAQGLVDSSRDAIAYVHEGMHIYANASYLELFGYSDPLELEGMPIMNMVAPADHARFKEFLRNYLKGQPQAEELELHGLRADQSEHPITMEFAPASYEGESCIQVVIRDQSASRELEERLDHLSRQDLLTGLYNRQFFVEQLKERLAQKGQGVVLFIQPNDFERVREQSGIAGSDLVLAELANLLRKHAPEAACAARFDAHIFSLLVQSRGGEEVERLTRELRTLVEEHLFDTGQNSLSLSITVGGTPFDDTVESTETVLERAEKALQTAAQRGKSLHLYNPRAEQMADRERIAHWGRQIKVALRDNQFHLLYQPIVSLHGDPNENYEVLLRLRGAGGEWVPPGEFIPAAEAAGLMGAVDRWVLAHAVKVLMERHQTGKSTNFFIKLSEPSLQDPEFLPWMRDLLKASRLEGNLITLEVSEAVAAGNLKAVKVLIDGLHQLRIRFALDHFGIAPNYASLLKHCNANFLKIDGSLIRDLANNTAHQQKVKAITAEAKEMERLTIAEFVEDANTLAALWGCGIDYIQGYFLQEPDASLDYEFLSEA